MPIHPNSLLRAPEARSRSRPRQRRRARGADPGTARFGDRPHSDSDAGDQGPADTDAGTEQSGDRPRTVPVKRKPQPEGPRIRSRGGLAKRVGKQPPLTVDQMAEQVRPHVSALLERDGNEAVT
ncbi:hypothetical protein GCM10027073_40840 [Streptomyces chlorus]